VVVTPVAGAARSGTGPRRGLFAVGLVMALVAFAVVFAIGLGLASRSAASVQHFKVLVASRDIAAREAVGPGMVALADVAGTQAPPGAITRVDAVSGMAAQVAILKGQVVTSNLLASASEPAQTGLGGYLPIPQGLVAVTIPTGEQQGVAGYIAAGDYINVLATVSTATFGVNPAKTVTKTIFTNMHVIRVGPAPAAPAQSSPQSQGVASSLTVVLSECDAQYLSWLVANASVKYVLLSYKDYAPAGVAADPGCPATSAPAPIGPSQVEARYGFTKI
jgi:Flp pilus assembly protein CpaB